MPWIAARHRVWRVALALLLALPLLTGTGGPSLSGARQVRAATALPTHFGIGLAAQPTSTDLDGWLPDSGIPWDYAYQYLAAGVNTGSGWEGWNERGQFPLRYARAAHAHGYIPTFSYYEMYQSNGSCTGCGEVQKDLSNLNNPTTMAAYYANFTLLMRRLGPGTYDTIAGYGDTAIVHIEPDFSGYAQQATLNNGNCYRYCTGTGNDPALLNAAVTSSGVTEVAAYPNTYQGFNWALLHLRDLYAPNVRLAIHISGWATGDDIGSDTRTDLDAAARGMQAGQFAARSGATSAPNGTSTYDFIFNDIADRDAGYYKYVLGLDVFWDRQNTIFPNFHRWETYLGAAIAAAGGKPTYVWQIPLGNQVFKTMGNTNGHYQDNRAEYFFGHIDELMQIGIVGLLFGAGNDGSTRNTDDKNDGTTNPASFCTGDGTSGTPICNTTTSTVADDDGGYLRLAGRRYYSAPHPLPGTSPSPSPTPTTTPSTSPTPVPTTSPTPSATPTPSAIPTSSPTPSPITSPTPGTVRYALTLSGTAGGTVAASPTGGNYVAGTTVTVTATPNTGYLLSGWTIDGVDRGWLDPLTLTMDRAHTVVATLAPRAAFADLPADQTVANAIQQLAARGIIHGYGSPDNRFGPNDRILRAQMAALIVRAMDWPPGGTTTFSDRGPVDDELWGAVGALVQRGADSSVVSHRAPCLGRPSRRAWPSSGCSRR